MTQRWNIDQCHNVKNWCIMANFKLLTAVMHKKYDGCGSNFARAWLQSILYHITDFLAFVLFIIVFGISVIIHQQLVAMMCGHMRFV